MSESALHWLPLTRVAALLAARELSALELTRVMLARIERRDPVLRSFATLAPERALAAARRADQELAAGRRCSALHGVPIAVKDLCDTRGLRSAAGMRVLRERVPDTDATVVARLEAAGAVLLGKLVTTEGAGGEHHPDVPPPRNPWSLEHWTGVSSSGSGVATAGGLCFGALGTDTAGSIRFPSLCCGVVGLKPTWGRVSRAGVFPLSASLDHVGPMARCSADAAALLAAIAGPDPRDPTALRAPPPDYAAALEGGLRGVRIGVDLRYATEEVEEELAGALLAARDVLGGLGATLREVTLPDWQCAAAAGAAILHADVALHHAELFPGHEDDYGPHLREMIEIGRALPATELARAHEQRRVWRGRLAALFEKIDLLLCPPAPFPALPAALFARLPGDYRTNLAALRFTIPYDVSGSPTLTLPCGASRAGLPLALQLVGRPLEEGLLLRTGHTYESATRWHERHPPDLDT